MILYANSAMDQTYEYFCFKFTKNMATSPFIPSRPSFPVWKTNYSSVSEKHIIFKRIIDPVLGMNTLFTIK